MASDVDANSSDLFVQELTQCQPQLQLYITAAVGGGADVEDIRQNVNEVLWRKRQEFVPGTSFLAWAYRIAQFEALKHQKARGKQGRQLSAEALSLLAVEAEQDAPLLEARRIALQDCLQKLSASDAELIHSFYRHGQTLASIAVLIGRSGSSVRHSIRRIRRQLKQCIGAALAREGQS